MAGIPNKGLFGMSASRVGLESMIGFNFLRLPALAESFEKRSDSRKE
jgi:hypothetical protein